MKGIDIIELAIYSIVLVCNVMVIVINYKILKQADRMLERACKESPLWLLHEHLNVMKSKRGKKIIQKEINSRKLLPV